MTLCLERLNSVVPVFGTWGAAQRQKGSTVS